jgi:hypothetical protein
LCDKESVFSLISPHPPGEGTTVSVTGTTNPIKEFMWYPLKGINLRLNAVSVNE